MTADGSHIFQRALTDDGRIHNSKQNKDAVSTNPRNEIVFAKAKNVLGENLLRYIGTYQQNVENSNDDAIQFDLVRTRENVRLQAQRE